MQRHRLRPHRVPGVRWLAILVGLSASACGTIVGGFGEKELEITNGGTGGQSGSTGAAGASGSAGGAGGSSAGGASTAGGAAGAAGSSGNLGGNPGEGGTAGAGGTGAGAAGVAGSEPGGAGGSGAAGAAGISGAGAAGTGGSGGGEAFLSPPFSPPMYSRLGVRAHSVWRIDKNGDGLWKDKDDELYYFGGTYWYSFAGRWAAGDVYDTFGVFDPWVGAWSLDTNGNHWWDSGTDLVIWSNNPPDDIPVVGNWDGMDLTKIGFYSSGTWKLDMNGDGTIDCSGADKCISGYGHAGDIPLPGRWVGGSKQTHLGVYRDGVFHIDADGDGIWTEDGMGDKEIDIGKKGKPVAGNWGLADSDSVGVYAKGTFWLLRADGALLKADFSIDPESDDPVVGHWDP